MIWHCPVCCSTNANKNNNCIVCNYETTHKGHLDDTEIMDIYLETIYWYMKAEVENRDYSAILSINYVQLNEIDKG